MPPDASREQHTKNAKHFASKHRDGPAQREEWREIISFISRFSCLSQEGETKALNSLTAENTTAIYSHISTLWFGVNFSNILNPLSFLNT